MVRSRPRHRTSPAVALKDFAGGEAKKCSPMGITMREKKNSTSIHGNTRREERDAL
jgi:hypothetical protein